MLKIQNLFIIQSALQFYLVLAYTELKGIPKEDCLVMAIRGSFLLKEKYGFTFVDGERYAGIYTGTPLKAYRENRRREKELKEDIVSRLVSGYSIYAANFYHWWQQYLVKDAGKVIVLEDGMGSYHQKKYFQEAFGGKSLPFFGRLKYWLKVTLAHGGRYADFLRKPLVVILNADQFVVVDKSAFPWIDRSRKLVLSNVFPAQEAGSLNGAWVLALSCFPEVGLINIKRYLKVIESVVNEIPIEGQQPLYVKLHPEQENSTKQKIDYQHWFYQQFPDRAIFFLGIEVSLECLAAGSSLKLVTGVSSVAIYATAANRDVYSYANRLAKEIPRVQQALSILPAESRRRFFGRTI